MTIHAAVKGAHRLGERFLLGLLKPALLRLLRELGIVLVLAELCAPDTASVIADHRSYLSNARDALLAAFLSLCVWNQVRAGRLLISSACSSMLLAFCNSMLPRRNCA